MYAANHVEYGWLPIGEEDAFQSSRHDTCSMHTDDAQSVG
jgi:hypothetical protein